MFLFVFLHVKMIMIHNLRFYVHIERAFFAFHVFFFFFFSSIVPYCFSVSFSDFPLLHASSDYGTALVILLFLGRPVLASHGDLDTLGRKAARQLRGVNDAGELFGAVRPERFRKGVADDGCRGGLLRLWVLLLLLLLWW